MIEKGGTAINLDLPLLNQSTDQGQGLNLDLTQRSKLIYIFIDINILFFILSVITFYHS